MNETLGKLSERALEMVMRDVMDSLAELAFQSSLDTHTTDCRILSIEPNTGASPKIGDAPEGIAEVVDLFHYKKAASS